MLENSSNNSEGNFNENLNNSNQNNKENSFKSSKKNSEQSSQQSNQNQNMPANFFYFFQNEERSRRKSSNFDDMNAKNLKLIIDKLKFAYSKMKGEEKSQTFKMILNNQDIIEILKELSRQNLDEIVVYVLNEFGIEQKRDNIEGNLEINEANEKEERFKDLFFLAIKKGQIKILEALNKQDINFEKLRDAEGNTGLILAVITSDIQIAKFFLK